MRWQRIDFIILFLIIILAFALRLYKINSPLADWHSWRQVDTAAVARTFTRDGFDLLHPRYEDLGNVQSGKYNPEGYRMVEFPLYNATFGALYKAVPILPLEVYGRLISILFSLDVIASIYYLVLNEEGRIGALFASLTFSVMPFFVYYSRVILPEMTSLGLIFISISLLYKWHHQKTLSKASIILFLVSILCAAASLLVKPTTIFFFLPLFYIFFKKWHFVLIKKPGLYIYFALSLLPLLGWRMWILNFPEGIPVSAWLITTVNTYQGPQNIFFKPAFFRWIFYERISQLISGGYLFCLTFIGALKKPKKSLLLILIGLSSIAYLLVFQGGNVQHDYYQTLILPAMAIFTGLGASVLIGEKKIFMNQFISICAVIAIIAASAFFSFYQIKGYYNVDGNLVNIAKIIDTITEPDSILITDRDGDTTLLYLTDRRGYPSQSEEVPAMKDRGAQYYVTLKRETADKLRPDYKLVFESDQVFIFRL